MASEYIYLSHLDNRIYKWITEDQRHMPTLAELFLLDDGLESLVDYLMAADLFLEDCWGTNDCQTLQESYNQAAPLRYLFLIQGIWTVRFSEMLFISLVFIIMFFFNVNVIDTLPEAQTSCLTNCVATYWQFIFFKSISTFYHKILNLGCKIVALLTHINLIDLIKQPSLQCQDLDVQNLQ